MRMMGLFHALNNLQTYFTFLPFQERCKRNENGNKETKLSRKDTIFTQGLGLIFNSNNLRKQDFFNLKCF